jgi:hypothetical protein
VRAPGTCARRQHADDRVVEGRERHSIALPVHQVGERGGEHLRVLDLLHPVAPSVPHRGADVEQDVAIEVRFLLELLHVIAIAPRVHLPVDAGEVVARQILPVLGEFHAEALERAAMQSGKKSFDDGARLQLERPQARDDGGVEKPQLAGPHLGRHG